MFERTLVKYIAPEQLRQESKDANKIPGLDIHLSKQSDSLDTKILNADLVVGKC